MSSCHSFSVHLHDFLFNYIGSCLSLFDNFWLELAVSVAGNCYLTLPIIADYCLFSIAVPTVSGVVPRYGVLLLTEMLVHFCFEHLLNCPGEKPFQLRLNISRRSDKQVYLAVCHQQLYQLHLSFVQSACSFRVQYLTFSVGIIGIYTVGYSDSMRRSNRTIPTSQVP